MPEAEERTLFLVWREPDSRAQYRLGELAYTGSKYRFRYDLEGVRLAQRHGFSLNRFPFTGSFPDLHAEYASETLFPNIASRLPDTKRPDYEDILLRFHPALSTNMSETVTPWKFSVEDEAGLEALTGSAAPASKPDELLHQDSFELLRQTRGRVVTDDLSFEEGPVYVGDEEIITCYVIGWRHYSGESVVGTLSPGRPVHLKHEEANVFDPNTVSVFSIEGTKLGYVPVYHSEDIARALATGRAVNARILTVDAATNNLSERLKIEITISRRPDIAARIAQKLQTGDLPRRLPDPPTDSDLEGNETITIGEAGGGLCAACDTAITRSDRLAVTLEYQSDKRIALHYECFELWNDLRRLSKRQLELTSPRRSQRRGRSITTD